MPRDEELREAREEALANIKTETRLARMGADFGPDNSELPWESEEETQQPWALHRPVGAEMMPGIMNVQDAPQGRCIHGHVLTCANFESCGSQLLLIRPFDMSEHLWWEKIGWVRADTGHNTGKGRLFCPNCGPAAKRASIGE